MDHNCCGPRRYRRFCKWLRLCWSPSLHVHSSSYGIGHLTSAWHSDRWYGGHRHGIKLRRLQHLIVDGATAGRPTRAGDVREMAGPRLETAKAVGLKDIINYRESGNAHFVSSEQLHQPSHENVQRKKVRVQAAQIAHEIQVVELYLLPFTHTSRVIRTRRVATLIRS